MEITDKDVKVLGRVVSITTESVVASSEQVYDENYKGGKTQSEINKQLEQLATKDPIQNSEIDNLFNV